MVNAECWVEQGRSCFTHDDEVASEYGGRDLAIICAMTNELSLVSVWESILVCMCSYAGDKVVAFHGVFQEDGSAVAGGSDFREVRHICFTVLLGLLKVPAVLCSCQASTLLL